MVRKTQEEAREAEDVDLPFLPPLPIEASHAANSRQYFSSFVNFYLSIFS